MAQWQIYLFFSNVQTLKVEMELVIVISTFLSILTLWFFFELFLYVSIKDMLVMQEECAKIIHGNKLNFFFKLEVCCRFFICFVYNVGVC